MLTNTTKAPKPNFFEFLVVLCCISLTKNYLQSLLKYKIFIIKILIDSFFIFLVLKAVFFLVYHGKAVRDDISANTITI